MPSDHIALGRAGEEATLARYLDGGFRLVARNWRCRVGELDLVVARPGLLVFCEVKCRRGSRYGAPFEAVHESKRRKLRTLAEAFLTGWREPFGSVRFDVASVVVDRSGRAEVHLFEDAF